MPGSDRATSSRPTADRRPTPWRGWPATSRRSATGTGSPASSSSTCRRPSPSPPTGPSTSMRRSSLPRWPTRTGPCSRRVRSPRSPRSGGLRLRGFTPSAGLGLPALRELARRGAAVRRRTARPARRSCARRSRRCSRARRCRQLVGGGEPARRRRRRHPRRSRGRAEQARLEDPRPATPCSATRRAPAAHRQRARPRRHARRRGTTSVRGLPRRADDHAVHLERLRLGAGRAARAGPRAPRRPGGRARRGGVVPELGVLLQGPRGQRRTPPRTADDA